MGTIATENSTTSFCRFRICDDFTVAGASMLFIASPLWALAATESLVSSGSVKVFSSRELGLFVERLIVRFRFECEITKSYNDRNRH